ncbi:DUF1566 domain-containing protein [bacterium]|nr:DUF1566 domain-containing protein [bacterium]
MKNFLFFATFMLAFFAFAPLFAAFNSSTVKGDIIVTDTETGLIWQRSYVSEKTWQQALAYCENLIYAGYSDWRLPNKNELASLVNYGKNDPASNFPAMPSEYFWSSSTHNYNKYTNNNAWYVRFYNGTVCPDIKSSHFSVRCVR